MKELLFAAAAVAAIAGGSIAHAAAFSFDFTYDGTSATLDGGSDNPDGASLEVGDTFSLTLSAAGDNFFTVLSDFSQFFPLSFATTTAAERIADIQTSFLLNGTEVDATNEISILQTEVHVGAQSFNLASGLMFDEVVLVWELTDIIDIGAGLETVISAANFSSFSSPDRPFFNSDQIAFGTETAPVPLPGAALLFAAGGLVGARTLKSKKTKTA